ncbi:hypothetical protein LP52_00510 [Streptomonospora alba]|uniref:Uncharacterized protein n=2 Tax=Streptomonospora alba TaxID=183763 RepID=A0A0C2GB92_9ACTN|nr:hypothetical protein LP52_00510 [Streptomonospora alba]
MKPGLLDLCGAMDDDVLKTGLYPRRQDEVSSPPDSATLTPEPSSGFRTVEDECSWLISPDGLTDWRLELSYEAYVESYGDTPVRDRAKTVMKSIEEDYASQYGSEYESPGKSTWGDRATVFYMPGGAPEGSEYSVIMRKKGVVCELSYKPVENGAEADEEAFQAQADPAARALSDEIHFLLPD